MKVATLAILFLLLASQAFAGLTWTEHEKKITVSRTFKLLGDVDEYVRIAFQYEELDGEPTFVWASVDAVANWDYYLEKAWEGIWENTGRSR